MQDNLLFFLGYCAITVIILNIINNSKINRIILFVLSTSFYMICDYKYLILLFASIAWGFFWPIRYKNDKKSFLFLSVTPLVILLFLFKWSVILFSKNILLPLGLSYYFFKIIAYEIDVFKGRTEVEISFIDFANYVFFFPQIVCGPIARIDELREKLHKLERIEGQQFERGIYRIIWGLFKKVVIADRLAPYVNAIFSDSSKYPGLALWIAAFLFTIEICCDFSGYSDIVIGFCNLMGIETKPNFRHPYFSYSISDFWRRWHISLSEWLRDYIYISLGGNRKGKIRKFLNMIVTFLISGAWHGAGANYLFWGIWHGTFNSISIKKSEKKIIALFQRLITFAIVLFGWIFFKSSSLESAFSFIGRMFINFDLHYNSIVASILPFTGDYSCVAFVLVIMFLLVILFCKEYKEFRHGDIETQFSIGGAAFILCMIVLFGVWGNNSFIYAGY